MNIKRFKKISNDKYEIILEDDKSIVLYEDVILKNNLLISKYIDKNELDSIIKENSDIECYNASLKYLSIRMRSKKELANYLASKKYSDNAINKVIKRLSEEGYIDEVKYAQAYTNDQVNISSNGPLKIRKNLKENGISSDVIDNVIGNIDENIIEEKLSKLIKKQLNVKKGSVNSVKLKVVNYLVNLGYDKDMVLKELSKYSIESNKDMLKKDYDKLYNKYKNKYDKDNLLYFISQKLYLKGYTSNDIKEVLKESN